MVRLHSKTVQANTIEKIDQLSNEFSDTHDVKFVHVTTTIVDGSPVEILHTRVLQYLPEEQKKDVKPDWYKCTTCNAMVDKNKYETCFRKHTTLVKV